jgi:branched-chain amino acid transport system permease protein
VSDASALATIGRLVRGPARRGNSRSLPVGLLAVVVVALVAPFYLDVFWLQVGVFAFAAMVAALGLNLLVGEAGQLSLAHSFFVAVGAYGYTFYASESQDVGVHAHAGWGLPPLVAVVLAVVTAGVAGLLFSPIAARLGGIYLGVASLGLVFLGQHVLVNAEPLTGGFNGRDVPPLTLLGFSFDDVPGKTLLAFRHIVPETFGVLLAIEYLAMIVIGGIGSPGGTLAGALFVSSLPVVLQRYSDALPFLAESPSGGGLTAGVAARFCYGAAIVVLLLVEPGGLAALGRRARRRFLAGTGGPAVLPAPSPAAAALGDNVASATPSP